MAWISVHEQVLGGKLRNLAKELGCSQNEALGLLVRLWLWGINNADKEGKIVGAEKADVAEVLTVGIDLRYSPERAVDALVATKWIDIEDCLYIHDWEEWQEQWYKAIKIREDNAKRKRKERANKREERNRNTETKQNTVSSKGMEADLPKPKLIIPHIEEEKQQPETVEYSDGFKEFWEVYPRKIGKGDAYKKYKARLNSGWKPEELLEAAKNYESKVIREHTDKQYIKHPKTFLSETEPFADFLPRKEECIVVQSSNENEDNPYAEWS